MTSGTMVSFLTAPTNAIFFLFACLDLTCRAIARRAYATVQGVVAAQRFAVQGADSGEA
jgi:hypothetical protein